MSVSSLKDMIQVSESIYIKGAKKGDGKEKIQIRV